MTGAVLLVDDDPDDADLVRLAFRRHGAGADLVVALDPGEAFDFLNGEGPLATRRAAPAVVLLDLKLRGASGIDLLRRIRTTAATASLPVVLMTSSVEARDVSAAYAAGANAYVRKPDTFEALVDVTGAILRFWVLCNEAPGRRASKELR